MHLPDGFLSATTCAGTGVMAAGAVAWAVRQSRATVGDRLIPLMGVMSACVFAAQMVNFPILWGTSGHLIGGVLAAIVLGPWAGTLAMTVVLVVQCLLFYDGGVTALGANILNMAVVGTLGGYTVYALARRLAPGPRGEVIASAVAAWLAVQMAAFACAVELWWSGTYTFATVVPAMLLIHSFIGVGEALITATVVTYLLRVRPDLLYAAAEDERPTGYVRGVAVVGLAVAIGIAFFLSPLASSAPDGLEHVTESLGAVAPVEAPYVTPLADYEVAGLRGVWLATSLAGVIGVGAVFALGWGLSRGLRKPASPTLQ